MGRIISQGAEALIEERKEGIVKKRISKSYRIKEIDEKIRKLRTRSEAKILEKAGRVIPAPRVLKVDENSKEIVMEKIDGERLSDYLDKFPSEKQKEICELVGKNIAKLHHESIIHGDLTPSNMILAGNKGETKIYLIDFGLGFISMKIEDKAVDLHLLKEALEAGFSANWKALFNSVRSGYEADYSSESHKVLERLEAVEKRGRYKQGS
ncbi:MAG: Kae1-associated serine/threonine protein kinase [Nanoarchaeota archaeon]|nr:Kae1-associated serine/threonine protein kinase [Nanoarchaeota archaeon]